MDPRDERTGSHGRAGQGRGVIGNDAAAFEDFFRRQTQSLHAHLCLITGNRAEAEELAQDAFLKVWERWDRVAGMEEPVGYLYRTAMKLFRKRYRKCDARDPQDGVRGAPH